MKYSIFTRDDRHSRDVGSMIINAFDKTEWLKDDDHPDLVICIGGDGTILRAIHKYLDLLDQTVFVGIHTGTLGFFTDFTESEFDDFIERIIKGDYSEEVFPLVEAYSDDWKVYALNEIRLGHFSITVKYDVYIDNEFFEKTCGSGICICTQAGSTGANRSLSGAVIDKGLDVLELTEIMPVTHKGHHSLKNPYIMRDDRVITITGKSLEESTLCFDYLTMELSQKDRSITIRTSDRQVRFARFKPYSYLKRLKNLY